jgi:hypothetical protein
MPYPLIRSILMQQGLGLTGIPVLFRQNFGMLTLKLSRIPPTFRMPFAILAYPKACTREKSSTGQIEHLP